VGYYKVNTSNVKQTYCRLTYCRTASTFVAAMDFVFSGMLCEQGIIYFWYIWIKHSSQLKERDEVQTLPG
jgi:hypothetical protein